jgi:fumarate reductase subunit C
MSGGPQYTLYHPRWHRRRMSIWWWLGKRSYTKFIVRELTSVFVAFYAVVSLCLISALTKGPAAYEQFLARMATPLFVVLHVIAFLFVLYHAITWFNLTPKAMVVRLGGTRVPDWLIIAGNYGAWIVVSAVVAFLLLRGA